VLEQGGKNLNMLQGESHKTRRLRSRRKAEFAKVVCPVDRSVHKANKAMLGYP
jgi:hypothetical protein